MAIFSRTPSTLHSRSPPPSSSTTPVRPLVAANVTPQGVLVEILTHKTELNTYCQKLGIPLQRVSAEQDVAKLALKHLLAEDEAKSTKDRAKSTHLLSELLCLAKAQWKIIYPERVYCQDEDRLCI